MLLNWNLDCFTTTIFFANEYLYKLFSIFSVPDLRKPQVPTSIEGKSKATPGMTTNRMLNVESPSLRFRHDDRVKRRVNCEYLVSLHLARVYKNVVSGALFFNSGSNCLISRL